MASYIGKVTIGAVDYPIANTVYAICSTGATVALKEIVYPDFDTMTDKVSIPIKFINGNAVSTGVTLKFNNSSDAYAVEGNCLCAANEVITFTYEDNENESARRWRSHKTGVIISEDSTSGILTIDGQTAGSKLSERIDNLNNSISGLTGAMHFRGSIDVDPTKQAIPGGATYAAGDVVLGPNSKEYVYGDNGQWIELGDEGSYVLISSISNGTASHISNYQAGEAPTLTLTSTNVSEVTITTIGNNPSSLNEVSIPTSITGTATTAEVSNGKLIITLGSDAAISNSIKIKSEAKTVNSGSNWTAGKVTSFQSDDLTVKVPAQTPTP